LIDSRRPSVMKALPNEFRSHQTVWIDAPGGRTAAVRYEMDGDRLVCFGDDGRGGLVAGTRITAGVRGLADGPLDGMYWVNVRDLEPDDVSIALLSDLVGDRPLGRTGEEVVRKLEELRHSRRIVALEA
jgi:hypothetical protein